MEGGADTTGGVENGPEAQAGAPGAESPLVAGRQVWVRVEAALQDVLVVSCGADGRHFQGVLLDCSKRFIRCVLVSHGFLLKVLLGRFRLGCVCFFNGF